MVVMAHSFVIAAVEDGARNVTYYSTVTQTGLYSNYIFCEDNGSTPNGTVPRWHELEISNDSGAIGSHTATTTSYTEMDRYVTAALNSTVIPGGMWNFRLFAKTSTQTGQLKAVIYRVNSSGVVVGGALGTAESAPFTNTTTAAITASVYVSEQTGWATTDRIGIVVSGKKIGAPAATVTWYHDYTQGWASDVSAPISLVSPTFYGVTTADSIKASKIFPPSNSVTAFQINRADSTTNVVNVDTTNSRVGIGTSSPSTNLDVYGGARFYGNGAHEYVTIASGDVSKESRLSMGNSASRFYMGTPASSNNLYLGSLNGGTPNSILLEYTTGNVGIGNSVTFGTSGVSIFAIGAGTAPTTSPAGVSQFWSANSNGTGTNAPHYRNEVGQSGVIAHQAPLTNLLTNSGFGVWSQGAVTATATGAAPVTDGANAALTAGGTLLTNGGVDSDTTSWTAVQGTLSSVAGGKTGNCLEITRTSGSTQYAEQIITTTVGKLYQASVWVKSGTSGDETAWLGITDPGEVDYIAKKIITTSGSWTQYSVVFEATGAHAHIYLAKISVTSGTMLFDSIVVHEIAPGCIAADTKGPDGMSRTTTTPLIYRNENDSTHQKGYYGLKFVKGADTAEYLNLSSRSDTMWLEGMKGRTITLGCALYSTSATDNVKLEINDSDGTTASAFLAADALTWVEVSRTVGTTITSFTPRVLFDGDTTDVAYVSRCMLIYGPSIGAFNWSAPSGEIVWTNAPIASTTLDGVTGFSDVAMTTLNLEADSSGKIPKGAKAVYVRAQANDSGSITISEGTPNTIVANAAYLALRSDATQVGQFEISPSGLPADGIAKHQGWQRCDSSGDVQYQIEATGSGTFDVPVFKVLGIQVN
jgi:hypothetical protein